MKNETGLVVIGGCLSVVFMVVWGAIVEGWALSVIWNWFIPPLFGLTSLTFFQAMGVALVLRMFINNSSKKTESKNDDKSVGEAILEAFILVTVSPLVSVLIAWVVLQFAF